MTAKYLIVYSTCPDKTVAQTIARGLISKQLAACVQIGQSIESVYAWQGELCQSQEVPLQIKCLASHYDAIEQMILKHHPYDVPEIIASSIDRGFAPYLQWIEETSAS
ncbi:divalent-cation tolerance protein CutA [Shewanella maritima]|uniref:divalent-cation tolerance protein CutA n=1 Tax=Shewanella maritima TaxID=2520507 RepID=UPI003736D583